MAAKKENLGTQIAIGLIKTVVCIYDVITFPIYFLVQQPWEEWKKAHKIYAHQMRDDDPYSPVVKIVDQKPNPFAGLTTMDDVFKFALKRYPNKALFGRRDISGEKEETQKDGKVFKKLVLGGYKWSTFSEINEKVDNIGKGLLALGVRPRQNIVILAETRIEWMVTAHACFRINIPVCTVYATLGEEGIIHAINETEVTHVITSQDLLPKLKNCISQMTSVTTLIYMESYKPNTLEFPDNVKLVPFTQLEKIGVNSDPGLSGEKPAPDDLAILMYTSGSTGIPKGVMITHKNIVNTACGFAAICPEVLAYDTYIAFLPLAHVLELAAETFFLCMGIPIGYSSPHTITDNSTAIERGGKGDATLLKPTVIASVPLIMDRIRKSVMDVVESKSAFAKSLMHFSLKYKRFWRSKGFQTPIMNALVFKKIRDLLGGRVRLVACGGAPLAPDTHVFIRSVLDCDMIQGYGLTETAAGATIMDLEDLSTGRVGAPLNNTYIKLVDWEEAGYHATDKPYPRGEIVIGGDSVAAGYYKNEALTKESFREEDGIRWFYSGDIGELHHDGVFKIIDRKKDLVKLQFGEYISLGKVETELKTCPVVENICIYGNSFQSYLVALVSPNSKKLSAMAAEIGKEHMSFKELCLDPTINSMVLKSLRDYGLKCKLQRTEIPTKVKLCAEEWVPDSGLVTAAFKLRRKQLERFYQRDISEMYGILGEDGQSKST